ncbi:MAG: hypothetical protein A4E73_00506 [Syntrophaceae bacterium PtaU1.Bin231]|nr:MAG: hypothetical protein A4E73_00506 [Syntrophaceae bacterium PtaU1.Bin231]
MVTRRDYTAEAVQAAKSVLIELMHLLGEYREGIVLIGGWIPELLLPQSPHRHVGSMDIDLALNHMKIQDGYQRIEDLLISRGYYQETDKQPFIFFRDVSLHGHTFKVQVDLLSGEYEGTGKSRRHQVVQGMKARKVHGCDIAFDMVENIPVEGEIPGGGFDRITIRVASIVPFIVMKGMALDERLKEKDAWDIYYCILAYPGGIGMLAEEFRPHMSHGLVQEALAKISKHFSDINSIGPKFVADFEDPGDPEERERIIRDAFERVHALLESLGYNI